MGNFVFVYFHFAWGIQKYFVCVPQFCRRKEGQRMGEEGTDKAVELWELWAHVNISFANDLYLIDAQNQV